MCHYHHLTLSERENLLFFRAQSYSISRIAAALGRDKSTISRELRRNTMNGKYLPITAQQQYARRRKACKPHKRLENAELFALVKNLFLVHHWSPEEIAGRLQLEHQKALLSYATVERCVPYMPVCLMKRRPPMGPAVRSTACGIMENPGIPGNIRNDGVLFPSLTIFRNGQQEPLTAPGEAIGNVIP